MNNQDDKLPEFKITPASPEKLLQWEKQELERKRVESETLLARSGAPKRHLSVKNIKTDGPWGKTVDDIKRYDQGFLAALIGTRGCGKTMIAVELMRYTLMAHQRATHYYTATEFFLEIKATYRPDSKTTELDVIEAFAKPYLLVIDEFGQRGETPWENRLLFELINRRYNDMKNTLLISNQAPEAFMSAIGPSLASRMKETGGIIHCNWESFR